jgi:hypothetical protein
MRGSDMTDRAAMKHAGCATLVALSLLLDSPWSSTAHAALGAGAKSGSREVVFSRDDSRGQRIARKIFAKEIANDEEVRSEAPLLFTAWANLSDSKAPTLLVMYGCSPTGNCALYGFERGRRGWRLVLNSIAQTCTVLPSSHGGRRDLSASMHGSATESTLKTYWWRRNRYVRVSERELIFNR